MQLVKISCSQCIRYAECPQKTRLFINYCGADQKRIDPNIKSAITECRARRGHHLHRSLAFNHAAVQVFH